jgi:hypothetical protein
LTVTTTEDIPVDLDIQGATDYKSQECQPAKDGKEKDISLHVLLVCNKFKVYTPNG